MKPEEVGTMSLSYLRGTESGKNFVDTVKLSHEVAARNEVRSRPDHEWAHWPGQVARGTKCQACQVLDSKPRDASCDASFDAILWELILIGVQELRQIRDTQHPSNQLRIVA